jgi:hypothetical protein
MATKSLHEEQSPGRLRHEAPHPRSIPILATTGNHLLAIEHPFQTGIGDDIEPDMRHRLVSEAAYARYVQRGYADGHDLEDWLQAEAQIDHIANRTATGMPELARPGRRESKQGNR